MKISISNKQLDAKPGKQEMGKYFNGLTFKTYNFNPNDFKSIIDKGFTITYLFKDNEFDRSNHYMSFNYIGTQFICVDIDGCNIPSLGFH